MDIKNPIKEFNKINPGQCIFRMGVEGCFAISDWDDIYSGYA
ncbi:Uncharacterised protein [[Clostridium] bolteae]|uniref:Uncharacterized protein n=1 Tax=Enterocloster bolteae TaxID=208479 RepID=A0A6N2S3Y1_9FIRM